MFYSRQKKYKIEKPVSKKDSTGFSFTEYEDGGTARIVIVRKQRDVYNANEMNLVESRYTGFTREANIAVGDRLAGKYTVDDCRQAHGTFILSLSSVGDGNE